MRWHFTDRVLYFTPWQTIACVKAGSLEEYSLLERWGEAGQAPSALLLESCIQAACWLVEASSNFTLSCALQEIYFWRVASGLRPGERFYCQLTVTERQIETLTFTVEQRVLKSGEALPKEHFNQIAPENSGCFSMRLNALSKWYAPADRCALWQEISA